MWQTVPKIANGLVIDSIRSQLECDTVAAQSFWDKLLYWATEYPTPPAQGAVTEAMEWYAASKLQDAANRIVRAVHIAKPLTGMATVCARCPAALTAAPEDKPAGSEQAGQTDGR